MHNDSALTWPTTAGPAVAEAFSEEVRNVREMMAVVSAATAAEPPVHLRAALLQAVESDRSRSFRRRAVTLAAAAAIVIGLAAFGMAVVLRNSEAPTVAEQILSAPDVHTVSGRLGDGTATVLFSRDRGAGVLVMNNVPPPGSVYQMWLICAKGPTSAGTMDD